MNELPEPLQPDTLEQKKQPLSEKDFIQESRKPPPFPLWLWLSLLVFGIAIVWGAANWFKEYTSHNNESKPFLEVTNRQFSLFLGQFPGFMRNFSKDKSNYLPGFEYVNKAGVDPKAADDLVQAPPEVIFLYHTWHRLLFPEFASKPIPRSEFVEFLSQTEIWRPKYWKNAPRDYVTLIETHAYEKEENLTNLPVEVQAAFQGWKNFTKEGKAINKFQPTYGEVKTFIKQNPNYARNFWRNIQYIDDLEVAGSHYLENLLKINEAKDEEVFPADQISPFLRVALYNEKRTKGTGDIGDRGP